MRLRNLLLLALCFAYALLRGAARRIARPPRRVCVIQIAKLGDMVCTTPMFSAIKRAYPEAKVVVVGNTLNREVLKGNPDVDEYLVWEDRPLTLARTLRRRGIDFAVTTSPNLAGLAALFLAGVSGIAVPYVVGAQTALETRAYRLLRRLAFSVAHHFDAYAPREYLRLLEPIGIASDDTRKHIYFDPAAEASVDRLLEGTALKRPFCVIAPGSGHPLKRWPPERFAAVAEHVVRRGLPVAVIGGRGDAAEVRAMLAAASGQGIVDLSERLSIEELKALISKASLFVSGDTGPLYLAEALGVSTIDIVGPASGTSQPPRGPRNIVIEPPRERPAMTIFHTQGVDEVETRRQAEATEVSEVLAAVDALLGRIVPSAQD